jgi:hypothetical protein
MWNHLSMRTSTVSRTMPKQIQYGFQIFTIMYKQIQCIFGELIELNKINYFIEGLI